MAIERPPGTHGMDVHGSDSIHRASTGHDAALARNIPPAAAVRQPVDSYQRRHSRWYEVLLLSTSFQLALGLVVVVLAPATVVWGRWWFNLDSVHLATLVTAATCFVASTSILKRIGRFSQTGALAQVGPIVTSVFFIAFVVLLFTRSVYSRSELIAAYGVALLWNYAGYFVGRRFRRLKYAVLPLPDDHVLTSTPRIEFRQLDKPDLEGIRYDGIVADLRGSTMTPEWERFLARCILARIPVFHVRQVAETITGRVRIDYLSENAAGALLPPAIYTACKRAIDVAGVLVMLPVAAPVMALTALAIRLDSPGPALFRQDRVGLGNRDFRICKFRSMYVDAEARGARFASNEDDRITRVGRFIRKTRLDELPQLWNVLKGDMSLIGPRPEQRAFADRFNAELPAYNYRHVVRPGITGWAQVMQGYAWDADGTRIKIQYDFYYIKHFSFWLDLLIVFKTIRVVLTGWGAR